jgi:hypothetical protein
MGMTALIVGSAPCALSDLAAACLLRPSADVIAVKFSVAIVHARVAVTHHGEHAGRMKRLHRDRWGDDVEIHAPKKVFRDEDRPHIDRIWPELAGVGGTSGWGAARIARLMGYDEVILCGCPLQVTADGEAYHDAQVHEAAAQAGANRHRGEPWGNDNAVRQYQRQIESDVQLGLAEGIRSMSGWTRQVLGAPHG